jgi:hypothetical protein
MLIRYMATYAVFVKNASRILNFLSFFSPVYAFFMLLCVENAFFCVMLREKSNVFKE